MVRIGIFIVVFSLVADQLSKLWIKALLIKGPIAVTENFNLVLFYNSGVSFSMLRLEQPWGPWLLSGLSLCIVVFLCIWLIRSRSALLASGLGLIIGGALGNITDRIVHGAVIDFLDFHVLNYHWPAFNVADTVIVCGAVVIILDSIVVARSAKKKLRSEIME